MRSWFLSYHSPDHALAERLKAAIECRDEGARVFFAPESLRAGRRWAPALAEAIAEANAFVLLVTDRGIGHWQEIECDAAFDRHVSSPDFPVVLMLLEGQPAPRLSFLKQLHWIVTPDPASEKDVGRLIDAVTSGEDAKPGGRWRYTSPYRGLSAMEEKDSDYFFGRERETVEALSVIAREAGRLPVLLGNSGVGKSSLAKAGVIASLRRQGWPETASDVSRPEQPSVVFYHDAAGRGAGQRSGRGVSRHVAIRGRRSRPHQATERLGGIAARPQWQGQSFRPP
jgi:hypothetical protein